MTSYISIVIPVYNTEKYLSECIQSVLLQTYTNYEILLIDDGSTDCSGDICDTFAKNNSKIKSIHKKNGGVSSARNLGIKLASGKWITFLDSDDLIAPSMLEEVVSLAQKKKADIVFTDFLLKYGNIFRTFETYPWKGAIHTDFNQFLATPSPGIPWGCIKTDLFKNNNIFFPDNLKIFEDFYTLTELILSSKRVYHIKKPLYIYRQENYSSATHIIIEKEKLCNEIWTYENILELFKEHKVHDLYAKGIYWRILYNKQYLVLNSNTHIDFKKIFPEKKKYILSSPNLNVKMKIMMWSISYNVSFIANAILLMRHLKKRLTCLHLHGDNK